MIGRKNHRLYILFLLIVACVCNSENQVVSLQIQHNNDSITITPHLFFNTSTDIKEAIDNGVKLNIIAKTQLYEPRTWWFDNTISNVKVTLEVSYFTLSKLYVVRNKTTGKQISFNSYEQLWKEFEQLMKIEIKTIVNNNSWVKMRIMLDKRALPTVMQLPTLFNSDWDVDTQWHQQKIFVNE